MPITRLDPAQLRLRVDPASLELALDTSELQDRPLPWIGQQRAAQAARFGLQMDQPDYHLFVLGEVGSGRSTLLHQMMKEEAARRPVPPDLCYLHNFESPEHPLALRLPAGEGRLFRQLMLDLAGRLQTEIPKRLGADDVEAECERLSSRTKADEDAAYAALVAFADERNFGLLREQGRLVFTQRDERGEPLTATKALNLSREQHAVINAAEDELRVEINRYLERARQWEQETNERLHALRRQLLKPLLEQQLQTVRQPLRKQIKDWTKLGHYFDLLQQHVLDKLPLFQVGDEMEEARREALDELLARLRVNVVVDNHGRESAPVIQDDNPLFRELFGSVEYQSEDDVLVTDFSRVRAGSLLKAHGGFLMLHLSDLLADERVWEKLRRFLRSGRLQIEEPGMVYPSISAVSLQPEPVDVDVKIVLIASVEAYYELQAADPEFARRFRCKVDFAESFEAGPGTYRATAIFVGHGCARLGLPHFSAEAVAAMIEQSHREAEDQHRQSALFGRSEALLVEAAALARARSAGRVDAQDVAAALQARVERHNYPEQRMQEAISDGERLLLVDGERIGQVNGLTVVDLGDYQFGFPARVTASTHAGDEGLLNIEREVEMSGPIHDKGVLILHSYLCALFAHLAPLALNAAVVFEQEYSGIEGDSASCAEFCALLSALSGLPVRQGIAVTGALNQHGEMLPVGGINEKIEGYFLSCQRLGLNGQQGVLIPERNRRHLMLAPAVVDAVRQGLFQVHTASHAADGMQLLSGLPFGVRSAGGDYPADTVLGRAQRVLRDYRHACDAAQGEHAKSHRWPRGPQKTGSTRR
ncbi:Lon protease family protein [Hydrogenophaga sp. PBL-H3]|uniref:Lon protease family protein n=1 Tax=Hydrogenophaga sp. PBL-H3 TaxID=434010 RepID=UPI00131FEF5A|nr:ATP-binding protein [Hydrogenophaga sp. PBL-H3]QHE77455.1 AAA family ATPase [Hydrogenophaga sp. PBL-H3]QHE81879.1 AAA family ATPase [Hydrogenophaga sp. PBL-H3]